MRRRVLFVVGLASLVAVVTLSVFLGTRPSTDDVANPSPLLGQVAPIVAGTTLTAGHFTWPHDRVVVVSFWASWCGPCTKETPELTTFAWQQSRLPLGAVTVGVVFNDSVDAATSFAAHYGALYPSVIDPGGVIANAYGVASPPATFIIDRHGRVAVSLVGATTAAQLTAAIASLS